MLGKYVKIFLSFNFSESNNIGSLGLLDSCILQVIVRMQLISVKSIKLIYRNIIRKFKIYFGKFKEETQLY